jgi:hypothetical protein
MARRTATPEDFEKLKSAVLIYCQMTAGMFVGGASGWSPPDNWSPEVRMAWQNMHDSAWDKPR